eukprot:TRINITY_DN23449_c0_g1_i1.p1 TRINITY_DN23449_c0_g1~~TRINITY_DN23449_c0_g1_i1.p1  ORF type:complete len:363 (+),score=86.86 TRINITY_DN23449_c0_g1_i1:58-1146(+)
MDQASVSCTSSDADELAEVRRQQDELVRKMNILSVQQAELQKVMPPQPRAVQVPLPSVLPPPPYAVTPEEPYAPVWDVKSPGGMTDLSTQAPLPLAYDEEGMARVLAKLDDLTSELGFQHPISDLSDVADCLTDVLWKVRKVKSVENSPPLATEESVKVLKHRLRKRDDEIASLRAALASQPSSRNHHPQQQPPLSPQSVRITPPRKKLVSERSFSPDIRHAVEDHDEKLASICCRIDAAKVKKKGLLVKRQDLKHKRAVTLTSLEQQQNALKKSESWWEAQKSAEVGQGIDFTAYELIVSQSSVQCEKLTDRVRNLLDKIDDGINKVNEEIMRCEADEAIFTEERERAMAAAVRLDRGPSV